MQQSTLCNSNVLQQSKLCNSNVLQQATLCNSNVLQQSMLCNSNVLQQSTLCNSNVLQQLTLCSTKRFAAVDTMQFQRFVVFVSQLVQFSQVVKCTVFTYTFVNIIIENIFQLTKHLVNLLLSHNFQCLKHFFLRGGCCGSTSKNTVVGGQAWAWWLVTDVQRTDEGQPRPKYIFNKCGTNIYFFTLQRFGPSLSPSF